MVQPIAVERDPFPATPRPPFRYDGFENSFLGFGTSRDKLAYGSFSMGCRLTDFELHALYYSDAIAAKAVNKRPAEMMRRGFKLVSKKNSKRAEEIQKAGDAETLQAPKKILRGMQWGRWWGGSVVVIGANDSPDLSKPLVNDRVREVKYLNAVDRRYAAVQKYQEDPTLPRYGEPEIYAIGSQANAAYQVHASRLVRFVGVEETDPLTMRALGGWSYSCLQRPYEIVRSFAMQFKAVEHLVADASQGVWKISNLLDMLTANRDELMTRIAFSDMTRSAGRAIMLDAEHEDFTRVATSFAGLPDVLDRTTQHLACALGYPVTILMGRSPAGMNATGDSDFRAWYDELSTDQQSDLKPQILAVYRAIGGANTPDDLDVEFNPLWEPTAQEKAATDYSVAQTDKIYYDMGAVQAGAVAIARFGSGNGKIKIDEEAAQKDIDNEIELMLNPPAPPVVGADPNDPNAPVPPVPPAKPADENPVGQ